MDLAKFESSQSICEDRLETRLSVLKQHSSQDGEEDPPVNEEVQEPDLLSFDLSIFLLLYFIVDFGNRLNQ